MVETANAKIHARKSLRERVLANVLDSGAFWASFIRVLYEFKSEMQRIGGPLKQKDHVNLKPLRSYLIKHDIIICQLGLELGISRIFFRFPWTSHMVEIQISKSFGI